MAEKIIPTAEDVLACFDRKYDRPKSLGEITEDAARIAKGSYVDRAELSQAKTKHVVDALVADGKLVVGTPEEMGVRAGQAKTLYATPEIRLAVRQAHFDRLDKIARQAAEEATVAEFRQKNAAEYAAIYAKHYVAPDYVVDPDAADEPVDPPAATTDNEVNE